MHLTCNRRCPISLLDPVVSDGFSGCCRSADGHFLPVGSRAGDAGCDRSSRFFRHAPHKGDVLALQPPVAAVGLELFGQAGVGCIVLGDNEQA